MKNFDAVDRFEQAHGAKIEKLFWIAGSLDNHDFKEFIEEMDEKDFKKCFPEIAKSPSYDYYRTGPLVDAFIDKKLLGFLAEVRIPKADNFRYDGKILRGWSVHEGICRIEYVYAESTDELLLEIEKVSKKVFAQFIKNAKVKSYSK